MTKKDETKVSPPVKKRSAANIPSVSRIEGVKEKIKKWIKQFICFTFSKPNQKENAVQYIFRQLLLTDSRGNPSWTVTILFYVLCVVGVVAYFESTIATSYVYTYNEAGKVIGMNMKGFSTEFYYLVISLSIVITNAFNKRSDRQSGEEAGTGGIIDTAKNIISKLKS